MSTLFDDLVRHTHAALDNRHCEAHLACPECGHASSPKSPHCSFSPQGWHCFSCGAGGSLQNLAERVELEIGSYEAPARPQEAPRAPATWLSNAEHLVRGYESHSDAWRLWQAYKPVSQVDFERCRLGVGVLPMSKCKHERLIVPILDGTMIVGLRGRAMGCDCGKWLAPGGTRVDLYPLYNQESLKPGCIVWIVENPIDALLIYPYTGVAIYSVSYWQPRWEQALLAVRPEMIIVALDNDLVGNGGARRRDEFVKAWLATHPRVPDASGIRLVNRLLQLGLPATLYDWGRAEYKADIGSLIMAGAV